MKKFICLLTIAFMSVFSLTVNAQTESNSRFFDNMSLTLKGGATTPIHHNPFWGDMRPLVGIEAMKGITPVISLGVEGTWSINTSPQWFGISNGLVFDRQHVGGLMKLNLMNMFGTNLDTPRVFELGTVVGIGWQHDYFKEFSVNTMYTKFGLDFDFNLGKTKAWTLSFKPDIAFNLGENNIALKRNLAFLEFWGGITYHFKNHDGTRFFAANFTQADMNALNDEINFLRRALNDCENKPVQVVEKEVIVYVETPTEVTNTVECAEVVPITVHFAQGSTNISNESMGMLTEFAKTLANTNSKVIVKGFASEEGSATFNEILSLKRATAVKNVLVGRGMRPSEISVEGLGATTQFGNTLESNRVVIVTQK